MIKADYIDKDIVVQILTKSFNENKSVNYVIKPDAKRVDWIKRLMEYSFNMCQAFGEVWMSEDKKGCVLVLWPHKKQTLLKAVMWDVKLAIKAIGMGRVLQVLNRESRIKTHHPKSQFCYLWFIGVDPPYQGKGIGSGLLKEILNLCEAKAQPIYLETSVEKNLAWYQHFGFEVFHTLRFSHDLYLMRRIAK